MNERKRIVLVRYSRTHWHFTHLKNRIPLNPQGKFISYKLNRIAFPKLNPMFSIAAIKSKFKYLLLVNKYVPLKSQYGVHTFVPYNIENPPSSY